MTKNSPNLQYIVCNNCIIPYMVTLATVPPNVVTPYVLSDSKISLQSFNYKFMHFMLHSHYDIDYNHTEIRQLIKCLL